MAAIRGRSLFTFLLITLTALVATSTRTTAATIGINYGRLAQAGELPSPSAVVALLQSRAVTKVRIYDSNNDVLTAFQSSGIQISPMVTNDEVAGIAGSQDTANAWISNNVQPFASAIDKISVGNEWLANGNDGSQLVRAMQNIQTALQSAGLSDAIKVTTPHAFDAQGYPPSTGTFPAANVDTMSAIFQFLQDTGSVFSLNVYPFFAQNSTPSIDEDYALFNPNNANVNDNGKTYTNLFDAMVDTFIAAMHRLNSNFDLPLVVTETGWPSAGDGRGVSIANAQTYNNNLVQHVLGNDGTPDRPSINIQTYIFALFNEDAKLPGIEQHWGLYYPDETPVYNVNLSV